MPVVKYIISKRPGKHAAYLITAETVGGECELLGCLEYRKGARRIGEELRRLAPSVPVIDTTLKGGRHV